ncbi:uncharacterized protein LOC117647130 isoform X3 [Thrips palmi]|uniref:Uncharacterized protein LOC117647130 isoform X3 n=1 Tax=Thrips palmi TaxID=161013 RepID=A0A6P8Z484_THRPL|nr:uncharacterized protein LOC117647130 isoform X3 [Thrips palmi]
MRAWAGLCLCLLLVLERASAQGDLGLGVDCDTSEDCRLHAYCGPGRVCACRETYVPDKDNITCLAGLRQKCQYDDGCVPNAYCRHQERCECKEGFIPTMDLLHCKSSAPSAMCIPGFVFLLDLVLVLTNLQV